IAEAYPRSLEALTNRTSICYIQTLTIDVIANDMAWFLSIVIPAYNEENRIERSLDDVLRFLEAQTYRAEVIVVDDGSSDETARRVSERASEYRGAGHEL